MNDISFERNPAIRYGLYLRPSYDMCRAQAEIHDLLNRQFGFVTAGVFMPHATIKGFLRSDASIAELVGAVDLALASRPPFPMINNGPVPFGRSGVALNVQHDERGHQNIELQATHETVFNGLFPFVHPACEFTPREDALDRFFAHLTLAMADIPDFLFDEVWAFLRDAESIGPHRFTAEYFHLYAFRSDNWADDWWSSIEWSLLHAWKLVAPATTYQNVT